MKRTINNQTPLPTSQNLLNLLTGTVSLLDKFINSISPDLCPKFLPIREVSMLILFSKTQVSCGKIQNYTCRNFKFKLWYILIKKISQIQKSIFRFQFQFLSFQSIILKFLPVQISYVFGSRKSTT